MQINNREATMNKFILILGLVLSLSANAWAESDTTNKQEFVNPIFYQPLRPLSRSSGYTYLTPTSIKSMTPLDKNKVDITGQCELLENKENFIKLLCNTSWQMLENGRMVTNTSEDIYTYEIKGMFTNRCLEVERIVYEITKRGNEKLSTSYYCISPSNYPSKSD